MRRLLVRLPSALTHARAGLETTPFTARRRLPTAGLCHGRRQLAQRLGWRWWGWGWGRRRRWGGRMTLGDLCVPVLVPMERWGHGLRRRGMDQTRRHGPHLRGAVSARTRLQRHLLSHWHSLCPRGRGGELQVLRGVALAVGGRVPEHPTVIVQVLR